MFGLLLVLGFFIACFLPCGCCCTSALKRGMYMPNASWRRWGVASASRGVSPPGAKRRAERSGGLHKRSAEDWGVACRREGRSSPSMSLFECQGHEFPDRVFYFIAQLLLFLGCSWVGNRAAFSD